MKKKRRLKKSVIYFLIIIVIVVLVSLFFIFRNSDELKLIYKEDMSANIFEEVYILDYIKVENGSILSDNEKLDTTSLGDKNIEIKVKDNRGKESTLTYTVKVVDKEKPVISFKDTLETYVNEKIDLLKDVSVTDNSKEEIVVEVVGEYDFKKAGEYNLEYVAKDSSGNEAREKFVLKAIEKKEENNSNNNNNNSNSNENNNSNNSTQNNSDGTFTTSKGFSGVTKNGITYIDNLMVVNKTYSLPESYNPGDLDSKVKSAAKQMFDAAKSEKGFNIWDQSGFRSYKKQSDLYNRYVNNYGKKSADTFSARPGHSEHQSGLAFDVCATNKPCINSNFDNTDEAKWLAENCYKYGFILRFPKGKENETGYMYESWHFRYIGDTELAKKLYNNGNWITLEDYFGITSSYSY